MSRKCTKELIEILAQSRNHKLLKMENYTNIKDKICLYCYTCKNEFKTSVHSYKNAKKTGCKYCKKLCISNYNKNKIITLKTRQKISKANKNKPGTLNGKFGLSHPKWKGGKYDRLNGSSTEAYLWRKYVKKLYEYKCVITGCTENLECHHLESWNVCKEKRNDPNNGVLIKKQIHLAFHKKYGYGNNTEKQFSLFCLESFNLDWNKIKKKIR